MIVNVHVKEKTVVVKCGEGSQRIIWLAHVGLSRYDQKFGLELGVPKGLQTDDGELLDSEKKISESIVNGQHVWVLLKGDDVSPKVPKHVLQEIPLEY